MTETPEQLRARRHRDRNARKRYRQKQIALEKIGALALKAYQEPGFNSEHAVKVACERFIAKVGE